MKLDVKLDKDDKENIKFSMDCDKEFSDIVNECMEGWGIIIRDVISSYVNTQCLTPVYPTEIYGTQIHDIPEKEEPKSSIRGTVVITEDEKKTPDDNLNGGDIIHTDPGINGMRTGTDPVIPDPVGKDGSADVDSATSEWNGETTKAPSK